MSIAIRLLTGQTTIVDQADGDLAEMAWQFVSGYAGRNVKNGDGKWRVERLHRVVAKRMGLDIEGREVDHINRDRLDNRRSNLRAATTAENQWNTGPKRTNSSGSKGVYWHKRSQKWAAKIQRNGKPVWLGTFATLAEAEARYAVTAGETAPPGGIQDAGITPNGGP